MVGVRYFFGGYFEAEKYSAIRFLCLFFLFVHLFRCELHVDSMDPVQEDPVQLFLKSIEGTADVFCSPDPGKPFLHSFGSLVSLDDLDGWKSVV